MKRFLLIIGLAVTLAGCQSLPPLSGEGRLSDAEFMNLWATYRDCRSSEDLETMRANVRQLHRGAQQTAAGAAPMLPLPEPVKRLVSKPPVRLSVDPGAMAADCALSTGYTALELGHDEVALEMFSGILVSYSQADYPYFVDQARLGLREVNLRAEANRAKTVPQTVSAR
jgi:hypothetical protein